MVDALSSNTYMVDSNQKLYLEQRFEEIKDKQGFLGNIWNDTKEFVGLGLSQNDCENILEKYKNGKVSFEEAVSYIENFEDKQDSMTSLLSNVITGIGAIAFATPKVGTIGWKAAFKFGAPIGALLKTTINTIDRATNDIEGDTLDAKTMAKDAISGALTGTTSAVSSGVGKGIRAGEFGTTVLNGMKCGAMCGSLSGATSYMTDVAFKDKEFNSKDLVTNTLVSGATSTIVGGVVGAGMYGGASALGTAGNSTITKSTLEKVVQDSTSSSTRKVLGNEVKKLIAA